MTYARILVAVDVSDAADMVAQRALQIGSGAEITAMHVIDLPPYVGDQVAFRAQATLRKEATDWATQRMEAVCASAGIERHVILEGHPAKEIRRYTKAQDPDLLVMGAHGKRGWQLMLGSTANAVLHGRLCDVLCVHVQKEPRPFRHVLAAVDAPEEAPAVLARAVAVAAISGARVSVVTVVRPVDYTFAGVDMAIHADPAASFGDAVEAQAQARLDDLATKHGVTGESIVRTGHPAEQIHALTDELSADLVVVGTHGRQGIGRLLGSTANAVLHGAKSDILAVLMPG